MFQQVFHRFNNLDTVVLFSGFNDIFLSKYIDNYDLNSVPFYFESEFNNRMNYPIDSFRKILYNILPKTYLEKLIGLMIAKNNHKKYTYFAIIPRFFK